MKIMNTAAIYDGNKNSLCELYESRLDDFNLLTPEVHRAVLELKLYHLPPYSVIPLIIRNRVALVPEIDLFKENTTVIQTKSTCYKCNTRKPLYGAHTYLCLECWSIVIHELWKSFPIRVNSWQHILNCSMYIPDHLKFITQEPWVRSVEEATIKEVQVSTRAQIRNYPCAIKTDMSCWTTPKKSFLALELGCTLCHTIPDFNEVGWLWSADFSDWSNGCCPTCKDIDPCYDTIWGMSHNDYRHWQDSYTSARKIQRTIARYGALSLLLVSPSAHWANYISKIVPHAPSIALNRPPGMLSPKPIASLYHSKARSLSDLGLDLNRLLVRGKELNP